nr:unnamed protein product [Callosobruchus analis]
MEVSSGIARIECAALRALQESAEMFLVHLFIDANKCAMHNGRITLIPKDIQLALDLRGGQF